MTQSDTPAFDCILGNIIGFMLPFFLVSAAGDRAVAEAAIKELIAAYNASTPTELDLVGRIIGFSTAALDNLRLSMVPGLSDTKVLRYRSNAVTLSRSSDRALKILEAVQSKREQAQKIPRPTIAAAPKPVAPKPVAPLPAPARSGTVAAHPPVDIEAMKRDARIMMNAFSKQGAQSSTAIAAIPNPSGIVSAAARQAVSAVQRA